MKNRLYLHQVLFIILFNLFMLIPFSLAWISIFVVVFSGISGILSGIFLIFSYLSAFHINLIPSIFYEHASLLFSYSFFFIGLGGLLLVMVSLLIPVLLKLCKNYYLWNLSFLGGHDHAK